MLTPEAAALHVEQQVAVVADVHLGYEWARASGGDCLPAHSLRETVEKLGRLLGRQSIKRLIIAGDLVESPRRCLRTEADLFELYSWLAGRGVELIPILGNHDPQGSRAVPLSIDVAGWTIHHGHRDIRGDRTISGHHHPVLRSGSLTAPCFIISPNRIVLPAFTPNAAGLPVGSPAMPSEWGQADHRCIAGLGEELLDFGSMSRLLPRLGCEPTHGGSHTRRVRS